MGMTPFPPDFSADNGILSQIVNEVYNKLSTNTDMVRITLIMAFLGTMLLYTLFAGCGDIELTWRDTGLYDGSGNSRQSLLCW